MDYAEEQSTEIEALQAILDENISGNQSKACMINHAAWFCKPPCNFANNPSNEVPISGLPHKQPTCKQASKRGSKHASNKFSIQKRRTASCMSSHYHWFWFQLHACGIEIVHTFVATLMSRQRVSSSSLKTSVSCAVLQRLTAPNLKAGPRG
jgi:hypothetical protein